MEKVGDAVKGIVKGAISEKNCTKESETVKFGLCERSEGAIYVKIVNT